jgi:hypothetical protein
MEGMQHYSNFWRGDTIRLRPIEQYDLDEVIASTDEPDAEAARSISTIPFPISRARKLAWHEAQMTRDPTDDTFYWMIERLDGQRVGFINTLDCERRVGAFKYALLSN